ncbi:MAG: hypothetical protein DI582_09300 [Azospirillum brasilense]|jgi:hypothetical protein|nr:MAG: hypothetical protein DI582_09300 [Azospirillum brasilense]
MQTAPDTTITRIAALNDRLRQTYWGGKVMMTPGITALPEDTQHAIFRAVQEFDAFTEDNDPYGEHDFGKVVVNGVSCFWKISYYDNRLEYGSEDPANPDITTRVLTIMLTSEY